MSGNKGAVPDAELLLRIEQGAFKGEWLSYFRVKRQNWVASLQQFPGLWKLFAELDEIFYRSLTDCRTLTNIDNFLPLLLFIRCHRSIRITIELALGTHITEAAIIARSAIEAAAIAHKIYREPMNGQVWLQKRTDPKAFARVFEHNKKANLFPESASFLAELHQHYGRFSEYGTHTTINSMSTQYVHTETATHQTGEIKYTEGDQELIAKTINMLIAVFWLVENAMHDAFNIRLSLDYELERMRQAFVKDSEQIRAQLVRRFGVGDQGWRESNTSAEKLEG